MDSRHTIEKKQNDLNKKYQTTYEQYQQNKSDELLDSLDDVAREILAYVDMLASQYDTDDGENNPDYQYVVETCHDTLNFIEFHFTYIKNERNENAIISKTAYSDLMRLSRKLNGKENRKERKKYIKTFKELGVPTYGLTCMTIQNKRKLFFCIATIIIFLIILPIALVDHQNLMLIYGLAFNVLYINLVMFFASKEKILLLSLIFYATITSTVFLLPSEINIEFNFGIIKGKAIGGIAAFILLVYINPIKKIYDYSNKNK
ncbi:hypothetical protein [Providencia manganoxydans]|uniref:hypothetical protein n=1 Tax=Providencia manganoxydans TaxID=2923283 RepID=UPI0032DB5388